MTTRGWRVRALAAVTLALLPLGALSAHGAGLTGTWTVTSSMKYARAQQTATWLFGGAVLVAGGENCNTNPCTALANAEVYNPNTGTWIVVHNMTTPRFDHTATLLRNGLVLVTGGCSSTNGSYCSGALSSAEIYNPKYGLWKQVGSMTTSRQSQTATLLRTGEVLIAGGQGCTPICSVLSSAELYNPSTGAFTPTGSMIDVRQNQTATLLPNGQVLVTGGYGCLGVCSSAELYDPSTGRWTETGSMAKTRTNHTATLLPNGQVLIAGGMVGCNYGCGTLTSAELYNSSTGTFTPTGSMSTARYLHTATLLPTGQVLVAGGANVYGSTPLASAEIYNPSTGTWTATSSMHAARAWQTAMLLSKGPYKGQVLVAGGYNFQNSSNTLPSAELYHP